METGDKYNINVHERKVIRGQVESENIDFVTGKTHSRDEL